MAKIHLSQLTNYNKQPSAITRGDGKGPSIKGSLARHYENKIEVSLSSFESRRKKIDQEIEAMKITNSKQYTGRTSYVQKSQRKEE